MIPTRPPEATLEAFAADVLALGRRLRASRSSADLAHLRKIARWGRLATWLGLATAWIAPNPVAVLALGLGRSSRWTTVAHHVLHRGYDNVPGAPRHLTSRGFARGWRRYVDWFDWLIPEAWHTEHNVRHHGRLSEEADPDQPERNLEWLRRLDVPVGVRYAIGAVIACNWRWLYYVPNTIAEHLDARPPSGWPLDPSLWSPRTAAGRTLWLRSLLPYVGWHFVALPLAFLPFGTWAAVSVLVNSVLAEVVANLHSFIVIVPNHCGDDLCRFDTPARDRKEHLWRQVAGSVNYRCGGDLNDFAHGWLNYQIEHHIWPDLSMRQYQQVQPELEAICVKHGIPYRQESVFRRLKCCLDVLVGRTSMPVVRGVTSAAPPPPLSAPARWRVGEKTAPRPA